MTDGIAVLQAKRTMIYCVITLICGKFVMISKDKFDMFLISKDILDVWWCEKFFSVRFFPVWLCSPWKDIYPLKMNETKQFEKWNVNKIYALMAKINFNR